MTLPQQMQPKILSVIGVPNRRHETDGEKQENGVWQLTRSIGRLSPLKTAVGS